MAAGRPNMKLIQRYQEARPFHNICVHPTLARPWPTGSQPQTGFAPYGAQNAFAKPTIRDGFP